MIPENANSMEYGNVLNVIDRSKKESFPDSLSKVPLGFPCGILHCTYEKYPKVLYANEWMFCFWGIQPDSEEWKEFIQYNVFFMVPSAERDLFKHYLDQASEKNVPVCIEHCVENHSGEEIRLTGWVQVIRNPQGKKEYLFLYRRISQEQLTLYKKRENAYLQMLENAYDGIFRVERKKRVIECVYMRDTLNTRFFFMRGMRLVFDCLFQEDYFMIIYEEDRKKVKEFFHTVEKDIGLGGQTSCQIELRTIESDVLKEFVIFASEVDEQTVLLCYRELTEEKSAKRRMQELKYIRSINTEMKENENESASVITTYRVLNETVFLRDGVNSYLPISGEPLSEFLRKEQISQEEYEEAVEKGKVVLDKVDAKFQNKRYMYLMQQESTSDENKEYLMVIYTSNKFDVKEEQNKPRVAIHTFGYFDVFVDGKPIVFHYEKSKEMLALLVDRKGSFVGNPYFISRLWEDEPYSEKIQNRCRQTAFRMMETLKQYGVENIIEKVDGHRRIVPEMVDCDYFSYIRGEKKQGSTFNGFYMSDYSWGEETLSALMKEARFAVKGSKRYDL